MLSGPVCDGGDGRGIEDRWTFRGCRGKVEEFDNTSDVGLEAGEGEVEVDWPLVVCLGTLGNWVGQVFSTRLTDDKGGAGHEFFVDCSGEPEVFFAEVGMEEGNSRLELQMDF